jgi:hypothetical protein
MMGIPASGKRIRVEGMNFYTLRDGRITEGLDAVRRRLDAAAARRHALARDRRGVAGKTRLARTVEGATRTPS